MTPRAALALVAALVLGAGCQTCRPDEELAALDAPRRARLIRVRELGSQFVTIDHVMFEVPGSRRIEVCRDFAGTGALRVDESGSAYLFRCGEQPWQAARMVADELFADCAPETAPVGDFPPAPLVDVARSSYRCLSEIDRGRYLSALARALAPEDLATVQLAIGRDDPERADLAAAKLDPAAAAPLLDRLCPTLRDPLPDLALAARAVRLCPLDRVDDWRGLTGALKQIVEQRSGEDAKLVREWGLLVNATIEPQRVGAAACAILEEEPDDDVALLAWLRSGVSCPVVERRASSDPPCGLRLDCDGALCSEAQITAKLEAALPTLLATPSPRPMPNWNNGDFLVAPEVTRAVALTRGGFPEPFRIRNARRRYARPTLAPELPSCRDDIPEGSACSCLELDAQGVDLCGQAPLSDRVQQDRCSLLVDDKAQRLVSSVRAPPP